MAYIFIDFQYYTFVKKNVCNFLSCPLIQTRYIDIEMFSFIQSSRKPSYRGQNFSNSRLSSPFVKDFVFSNVTSEITIHKNLKFSVCWQPIRLLRRFISRKLFLTNILHEVTCKFICKEDSKRQNRMTWEREKQVLFSQSKHRKHQDIKSKSWHESLTARVKK